MWSWSVRAGVLRMISEYRSAVAAGPIPPSIPTIRSVMGASRRDLYGGRHGVLGEVPLARRNVPRKREPRQSGHGDVVRSSDAAFEHAAAPDGDAAARA